MSDPLYRSVYNREKAKLDRALGFSIPVTVILDFQGAYPNVRDYAKTDGRVLYLSPKILTARRSRIEGLLRHELAHIALMHFGDYDHSEAHCDRVAEELFHSKIYYDRDFVQNSKGGSRPRPAHLPTH